MVRMRIYFHGSDLYSFVTVDREPQKGEPISRR